MKTLNDDDHAFILDFLLVGGKQTGHGQAWLAVHRAFNFDKYLTLLIKYYTSWCNHRARKEERLRAVVCWLLDSFKICVIKPRYCPPIIAIGADTRSYNNVKNFLTHSTSGRGMARPARQLGPPDRGVRTVAAPCDCGRSEVSDNCCELFLIVFCRAAWLHSTLGCGTKMSPG